MTQAAGIKILAALIALQVLVGGVALATVDDESTLSAGTSTTTTAFGGPSVPGGTPVPGGPGEQPAPAPGQPGGPPAAGEAPPPPAPGPARDLNSLPDRPTPPRPGAYTYRTKFDGQFSASTFTTQVNEEEDQVLRYESAPAVSGEPHDREKAETSGGNASFNFSGNADKERAWRQNGMFVTAESGGGSGQDGESFNSSCDWQPDVQELEFPLQQGAAWSWNSTCESKSENFDIKQTWRGDARVTGVETATVGGREVRVLVIERRSERQGEFTMRRDGRESRGKTTLQETTRQLYAPSVALSVRSDSDMKGSFESDQPGGSGQFGGKYESELQSLDPR